MTTDRKIKRAVLLGCCGGAGTAFGRLIMKRLPNQMGLATRFVDTACPDGVPSTQFTELRPDWLPDVIDERLGATVRSAGLSIKQYIELKNYTGSAGIAKLPALAYLAAMMKLDDLVRSVGTDFRALTKMAAGVSSTWMLSISSTSGGTGHASARALGCAFRLAAADLAPDARWIHIALPLVLLPESAQTRRARALEYRSLSELSALMQVGASLPVPGRAGVIDRPGPDFVLLAGSSAESPRTFDEVGDEVAAIVANLINF